MASQQFLPENFQDCVSARIIFRTRIPRQAWIIFMTGTDTASAIDDALISVWRQALVEQKKIITVGQATFSARRTAKHRLAQVDFELNGLEFRGLEQNPQTKSRWAKMAREGAEVMQFLRAGRYVAVVADGVLKHYSAAEET